MIVKIKNLKLTTTIGVYDWEKSYQRTLVFNVEIETDFLEQVRRDNLVDVVDYDIIVAKIKGFVEGNNCQLIEKMSTEIMDLIMEDKRIKICYLEIDKQKVYDFVDSF